MCNDNLHFDDFNLQEVLEESKTIANDLEVILRDINKGMIKYMEISIDQ